ncbi:hypothetical protein NW767_015279 [Fusarium falciforme]|nr:hypothetical protein NW767_015279 [Fusarium falciforme]
MAKCWLFVVCAVAFVAVNAADDLSDFSNNLATDIGPLLVLFGESMTRQYLSESTSFLDYFIFAMAPIGILTAVVSAIRVCGRSSLRAFIGRSQEGDGVVEAELCTSTSRDVCELFNKGGITRVLGRPSILELVDIPSLRGADKAGLFLFQDYLKNVLKTDDQAISGWMIKGRGSIFGRRNVQQVPTLGFAPKPNLSLNVGIKKWPRWVFFAVAAMGLVLQAGVLALAGVGVWILHWNLIDAGTPASRDYAPIMFITGTVLLCGGMWSCAALIGQTTRELRYRRDRESAQRSHLLWLQPGPQVIGDQSFDPFVYIDKRHDPLLCWTSSTKDFDEKFEVYTFFAVLAVLVGYIVQFIGLRGMKAWVSLAQLGITVVMSIFRGLLRMQRLGRYDNKLAEMNDLVAGHELDWLAFEIALQEPQMQPFWHITGQHEKAAEAQTQDDGSTNVSQSHELSPPNHEESQYDRAATLGPEISPQYCTKSGEDQKGRTGYRDLLKIRERLSHLTGYPQLSHIEDSKRQKWKDDHVKVRTSARSLSAAICQAAECLSQEGRLICKGNITLRVKAVTSLDPRDSMTQAEQLIDIILKPPGQSTQTNWNIDSAKLEAILGLWMWSLVSDKRLESTDDSGSKTSLAESVKQLRIVSAGPADNSGDRKTNRRHEMNFWLGSETVNLSDATLAVDKHDYGLIDLWPPSDPTSSWERLPKQQQSDQSKKAERFCGWNVVYESLRSEASVPTSAANTSSQLLAEQVQLRVQYVRISHSLLDICVQDLFIALIISLKSCLTMGDITAMDGSGSVQLDNPTVNILAKIFVGNGLGSHSDALLCIIPALENELRPGPQLVLWAIKKGHKDFMQLLLGKNVKVDEEDGEGKTPLLWAARNGDVDIVRLLLNKNVRVDKEDKSRETPLVWAARNRYVDIVRLLLSKKANVNKRGGRGRTPLWWAARYGFVDVVQLLLDNNAKINLGDESGKTPLSWAHQNEHMEVVRLLDKYAKTELEDASGRTLQWGTKTSRSD